MKPEYFGDKAYYSADAWFRKIFGCKVYRLALDGGMSCPNRDGRISYGGCTFCSAGGSGDFAVKILADSDIEEQLEIAKQKVKDKCSGPFIAYFQSFTNTYASVDYLKILFEKAINAEDIVALDIGTRPDCLEDEKIELLKELNRIKPVMVELGLQTIHEETAKSINRGYELDVFESAVKRLSDAGINVIVHLILGLPGESRENILDSVRYAASKYPQISGIKLSMLHVLKGTAMGEMFTKEQFHVYGMEEYIELLIDCLEVLPEEMVVHRITGDGPRALLLAPLWSTDKKRVMNSITKRFKERDTWQGRLYGKVD